MNRTHVENYITRIFLRAVSETRDINTANLIVMGDFLNDPNYLEIAKNLYKLTDDECLYITNILHKE